MDEPEVAEQLWWVTVTDWNGVQVYDGPAPCPRDLVCLDDVSFDDVLAGHLFTFDMQPMGTR